MIKSIAAVIAGCLVSSAAFANTCASPIIISSNNSTGTFAAPGVNSCDAGVDDFPTFPGGVPSPGPDVVHSFVADGANATITVEPAADFAAAILLLSSCNNASANILGQGYTDDPTPGAPISMSVGGLTDGQTYYVVLTHHPFADPANRCGTYTGDINGQLPVELQEFSVD